MKPYKVLPPLQTINNIRKILESLNIFTLECHIGLDGYYHSCRVCFGGRGLDLINVGANGKGMTSEFALASAYGELMERIQNRMIFKDMFYATEDAINKNKKYSSFINILKKNDLVLEYRYYPDEKKYTVKTTNDLLEKIRMYLPQVFFDTDEDEICDYSLEVNTTCEIIEAPFFNVKEKKEEFLPIQLIRLSAGSTGLCAGNTSEEAILQGINEIFERYVLQRIYIDKITPPTIPNEVFSKTKIIKLLERLKMFHGIRYEIKDCSLGKKFPVIGLLLVDTINNTYAFRLGADSNPIVALERCYTEAFQGVQGLKNFFIPINHDSTNIDFKQEYNQNVLNGAGRFPDEIFLCKSSYSFNGLIDYSKSNNKEELHLYEKFIEKIGCRLFIRDNSFLNFPAFHVYIAGLSEVSAKLYNLTSLINRIKANDFTYEIPYQYRIKELNKNEIELFVSEIESKKQIQIELLPYSVNPHNILNKHLLLALLYFKLDNFSQAYTNMSLYIEYMRRSKKSIEVYYYAVRDYFYWMNKFNKDKDIASSVLCKFYGKDLVEEIFDDLKEQDNVFRNFELPNCFNCESCDISTSCKYFEILKIDVTLQKVFKEYVPNQNNLNSLFLVK